MPNLISNAYFIKKGFPYTFTIYVLFFLSLIQCFAIDSSSINLLATFLLLSSCFLSLAYFKRLSIASFPNSFIVLFGSFSALCMLPLILRTFSGKSLVVDMNAPGYTFSMIFIFNSCALLIHFIYTQISFIRRLRDRLRFIVYPANAVILNNSSALFIGLVGFAIHFRSVGLQGDIGKVISMFSNLGNVGLVAYFIQLIYYFANRGEKPLPKISLIVPVMFFVASIAQGLYFNSRNTFAAPILISSVALSYLWFAFGYRFKIKYVVLTGISLFLLLSLISGISSAILMARSYRGSISATELFSTTLDFMLSGITIDKYDDPTSWWKENYYDSEFANRFSAIKMIDNTLYIADKMTNEQRNDYASFQLTRLVSILPTPLLTLFGGSGSSKFEVNQLSSADYLLEIFSGVSRISRLTGSFMSDAYILFGWFSPFILSLLFLIIFPVCDVFVINLVNSAQNCIPSVLGLSITPILFMYLQSATIVDMSVGILRTMLELSLVFLFASRISKLSFRSP